VKAVRRVTVANAHGLHARPAMAVVECAGRFECDVVLARVEPIEGETEPTRADGKSVMQVVTLAATQGTEIDVEADGVDAEAACDAIETLFVEKFDEE
jgi:phosphocarrier protein